MYQQDCYTPVKLQQKVFTNMMLHFCRRGRENAGWRSGNQVYNSCVFNFNESLKCLDVTNVITNDAVLNVRFFSANKVVKIQLLC